MSAILTRPEYIKWNIVLLRLDISYTFSTDVIEGLEAQVKYHHLYTLPYCLSSRNVSNSPILLEGFGMTQCIILLWYMIYLVQCITVKKPFVCDVFLVGEYQIPFVCHGKRNIPKRLTG